MDINSVITQEEYENIRNLNYNQFSGFLMKVVKLSVEEALKALPHVMAHLSKQVDYLKNLSTEFYTNNKDLISHKPLVAQIIEHVEADNPGILYEEVLKISAAKAREAIARMSKGAPFEGAKNDLIKHVNSKLKEL